jgi:hypothetical protein
MRAMVQAQALERIDARLEQLGGAQATRLYGGHEEPDRPLISAH